MATEVKAPSEFLGVERNDDHSTRGHEAYVKESPQAADQHQWLQLSIPRCPACKHPLIARVSMRGPVYPCLCPGKDFGLWVHRAREAPVGRPPQVEDDPRDCQYPWFDRVREGARKSKAG